MGGFGSGRREYARTPTVERCRHLDVDELTDVVEHPGSYATVSWGEGDDAANIKIVVEGDAGHEDTSRADRIRFLYTTEPGTEDEREHDYTVGLEYTEPHLGGVRPWFQCPACGERRGKLYLPPRRKRFACRECYELGYQSSRSSGNEMERAEQRYRKAFAKADAEDRRPHPNNSPWFPERPKGMHHDTFEDLVDDVQQARREWDDAMQKRLRSLASKYDYDLPPAPSGT